MAALSFLTLVEAAALLTLPAPAVGAHQVCAGGYDEELERPPVAPPPATHCNRGLLKRDGHGGHQQPQMKRLAEENA